MLERSSPVWAPRFQFFVDRGLLAGVPTPRQVRRATVEMIPFAANETPVERAANRWTLWGTIPLRVPLQLAYCPQQIVVWNGLRATPKTLVKHLLSSFHEDGVIAYDLQLLATYDEGLPALGRAARAVAAGTHPLAPILRRIAGNYHAHLAALAADAERGVYPADLDERFSSLVGFGRYALTL